MKQLLLLPLLLTACSTPKFARSDCAGPNVNMLEPWEDETAATQYKVLVLDVGHRSYHVLAPSPFGLVKQTVKFEELDERFVKVDCPVQATSILEKLPSDVK